MVPIVNKIPTYLTVHHLNFRRLRLSNLLHPIDSFTMGVSLCGCRVGHHASFKIILYHEERAPLPLLEMLSPAQVLEQEPEQEWEQARVPRPVPQWFF